MPSGNAMGSVPGRINSTLAIDHKVLGLRFRFQGLAVKRLGLGSGLSLPGPHNGLYGYYSGFRATILHTFGV